MVESKQTADNQYPNADRMTTDQPYVSSVGTSTGARVNRTEDTNRIRTGESATGSVDTNIRVEVPKVVNTPTTTSQSETRPVNRGINPALGRLLVGGLIGASLGSLAAALAGKKTSEGVNHAVKGVGKALNTVSEGLNQTAKGVGEAATSIAEGAKYAVVGGASEAAKGIAEGAKQTVAGTLDVVQDTAQSVSQTVEGASQGVANTIKNTGENIKPSPTQGKVYQRIIVENQPSMTDAISMRKETDTPTIYISTSEQKESFVSDEPTTPVNSEMSIVPKQDNLIDG